ncbi:putative flippase GtrA [Rhizobium tibeticum]|uniref:GtrA family protein n=1 Tax=Rhizobium tibeticum TaxID=501024 RepID=UPI002787FA42|nr:putative flippase GtrA [Rhizobium tibeticum]
MRATLKFQLSRYALVGILNTSIGLSLIYTAMYSGFGDLASNIIGYAAGFAVSYCLNTVWTFQSRLSRANAVKYALLVCIAYFLNVLVVLIGRDLLGLDRYVAQFLGVLAYTTLGFAGSRLFVFK